MNYEQIRQKVKKQYKAEIDELRSENLHLRERCVALEKQNKQLKRQLLIAESPNGRVSPATMEEALKGLQDVIERSIR